MTDRYDQQSISNHPVRYIADIYAFTRLSSVLFCSIRFGTCIPVERESVCENGYDLILAFTITRNRRNRYRFVSWLTESNHFFD